MALAASIEAEKTKELIDFVSQGRCASIATAIVAGGNPRATLRGAVSERYGVQDGASLLHLAVNGGHVSACKLLISQGTDTVQVDAVGMLPIHYAAAHDEPKVVEALLDAAVAVQQARFTSRARLERRSTAGKALHARRHGTAPEFDAARYRLELIEKHLLFRGRSGEGFPLPSCVGKGSSLLHISAATGAAEVVASCLAVGCNPDARDDAGMTPVLAAAYAGQFAPIMILSDSGADLGRRDPRGRTAMAAAAEGGHTSVCEVLASMRAAQLVRTRGIKLDI